MDLVDVGAAVAAEVVEVGVVDPLGVEGDVGIGDRALAARDQHFLAAVGVQQHQVGRGPQVDGLAGVRPDRRQAVLAVVALDEARRPDVDDVVVVLDRLVGRDGRRVNAQRPLRRFVLAGQRLAADEAPRATPATRRRGTLEFRDQHGSEPSLNESDDGSRNASRRRGGGMV